jgi:MFS family permease
VPRLPDNLRVLRRRDFRLLFIGQGVSVLGHRMVAVALAFAVLEVGGSASAVGLVLACAYLPLVASVLIGGVVADRSSRRSVMIAADLVRVASQGATATLLIAGVAEVWTLALFAGLTGAATGFFNPASTGLLPDVVPAEELQPANALRATAVSTGEIAGPLWAGVLVAAAGAGWAMAVDAATFAVSALCLWRLSVPGRVVQAGASFLDDLREGWDAFRARRWVWTFVVYFAVVKVLWGAWSALGPVVADRELGGVAPWGVVLGSVGFGALAGSLLATRAKPRRRHVPAESLSRVASYDWFGSFAFFPIGLAMWGPVAGLIGVSTSLWIAFGLFIALIAAQLALPDTRRVPPFTRPRAAPLPR